MISDAQHAKDREDLRFVCAHIDDMLQNMRAAYEQGRDRQANFEDMWAEKFNTLVIMVRDLVQRVEHLERGGREEAPVP